MNLSVELMRVRLTVNNCSLDRMMKPEFAVAAVVVVIEGDMMMMMMMFDRNNFEFH